MSDPKRNIVVPPEVIEEITEYIADFSERSSLSSRAAAEWIAKTITERACIVDASSTAS